MSVALRRTKIVATMGPASESPEVVEELIRAGVDVVRLNFSHGEPEEHRQRVELVREKAEKLGRFVAVLGDLQGPKIRIARFKDKKVTLEEGATFYLDATLERDAGDDTQVGIDYKALPQDCSPGDTLLIDDGRLVLTVDGVEGERIQCTVKVGGVISNNKGINRQGGGLSAPALTDKDIVDIKLAAEIGVDYLAVSFPRSAEDMNRARQLMQEAGGNAGMVAKIERAEVVETVDALNAVIDASDGVMVARGDLGVEIGDAALVGVQKQIISRARKMNKAVITATQMMESMIDSQLPTRAEVFDVANAVLDGTDAVMLSAETAAGSYPVQTVEAMVRVILGAEEHPDTHVSKHRMHQDWNCVDESIALSAMYVANHLQGVKAIVALTESGTTPRLMSRISSKLPIYAFSPRVDTQRRMALYRGVNPVMFNTGAIPPEKANQRVVEVLKEHGLVDEGDLVILSKGDYANVHGGTNTLKILQVGDRVR